MAFNKEARLLSCWLLVIFVAIHKGNAFEQNEQFKELEIFETVFVDPAFGERAAAEDCVHTGQFIADDANCTIFYVCDGNNATLNFTCPDGQYFNPQINTCDANYVCPLSPECENQGEVLPDPLNCASYYFCEEINNPQHNTCPDGEFFSTVSHVCEPQANVDCQDRPGCLYPGQSHPNYQDCTSYYICNASYTPVPVPCEDGLSWDIVIHDCVPSSEANCATLPLHKYKLDVSQRLSTGMKTKSRYVNPSVKDVAGSCTRPGQYLPDDASCEIFYICDASLNPSSPLPCPNGTLFDPTVNSCQPGYQCPLAPVCESPAQVFPDKEDCASYYFCEFAGKPPEKLPCGTDQFFSEELHYCAPKDQVDCNGRPGCEFAGQSIPDAYDCTYYFVCLENTTSNTLVPTKVHCPTDTAWDTEINDCVPTAEANCAATPSTIPTTPTISTPSGLTCTEVGQTFPDPYDCASYYECDVSLRPNHHTCDPGTSWDTVTELCKDENTVTCNTVTNPTTVGTTTGASSSECTQPGQVIYNEADCAVFYTCDGSLIERTHYCNVIAQLYYDPAYANCNLMSRVVCSSGVRPQPTPTAFPISGPTPPPGTVNCVQPGQFVPYAADCKYFYKCSATLTPELFSCPPDLEFSASTGCCDLPQYANCSPF